MKTIPIATQAMLDSGAHTLAFGMKIVRAVDGAVSGWTEHDVGATVTIDGDPLVMDPANALNMSAIARTAGFSVDNLEVTILQFDDYMTKADVYDGLWDNSEFFLFQYDFAAPDEDVVPWIGGTLGNFKPKLGSFTVEFRDWRQYLQQDTTRVTQANCDAEFGGPRCNIDLGPHTYTGIVTAVASDRQFTAAALAPAGGTFDDGKLTWTSGLNAGKGKPRRVKSHAGGGVLVIWEPAVRAIGVDDEFTIVAGCPKTRAACKLFGNILNFQGFDQKPTTDQLTGGAVVES